MNLIPLKTIREAKESAVSELVGTLLLIAITVVLMTSLGIFLFSNVPTGSAHVPQVDFKLSDDQLNYSGEFLLSVDSVTCNIPVNVVSIEFAVSGISSAIIIPLNSSQIYYSYPVLMQMNSYSGLGATLPIEYFNASIQIRLYIPQRMTLNYVNIIDRKANAVVGSSPVTSNSVTASNLDAFPWIEKSIQLNENSIPSLVQINSTYLTNATCNGMKIFQSFSTQDHVMESNSSSFNKSSISSYPFWHNRTTTNPEFNPFDYAQLNSNSNVSYGVGNGLQLITNMYLTSNRYINVSLCTSEPVFLRIYNSTTVLTPFNNKTSQSYKSHIQPELFNEKLLLHKGTYFIELYYFYADQNGILAVNIPH